MQTLPWIIVLVAMSVILPTLTYFVLRARTAVPKPLPTEWALASRPVFSPSERRVHRLLREALPHHLILSKLPLVRFCQPIEVAEVRFWYDLLGSCNVSFAICSTNGRVLAAIDLETDRGSSRRVVQIKQSVLAACRIAYLRVPVDHLPSVAEVQLLVPQSAPLPRGPQPAPTPGSSDSLLQARETLSSTVANRRAERTALWQDSTFFQDSFFTPDLRPEGFSHSEPGSLIGRAIAGSDALRSGEQAPSSDAAAGAEAPPKTLPTGN